MGRETDQGLGIRKNRGHAVAQEIALVNADQSVQQSGVLADILVLCQDIFRSRAGHDTVEDLGTECQRQDRAAYAGGGRISAADIVIHVEGIQICGVVGQRRCGGGNSQHMPGRIQACLLQSILDEHFVGQGLQGGAGLGNDDKESVCQVGGRQDCGSVVRVYVGDELGLHLQSAVDLCPVLQSQIQSAGAQVGSADADLNSGGILLALFIDDLACMDLLCKFAGPSLLLKIEFSLVLAVCNDVAAQLAAAELMQDQSLLTGIDHFAVVEGCVFIGQFLLVRKALQGIQKGVVHLLCSKVIAESVGHGHAVLGDALRAVLARHCDLDIDGVLCKLCKFPVGRCFVKINPLHVNSSFVL